MRQNKMNKRIKILDLKDDKKKFTYEEKGTFPISLYSSIMLHASCFFSKMVYSSISIAFLYRDSCVFENSQNSL